MLCRLSSSSSRRRNNNPQCLASSGVVHAPGQAISCCSSLKHFVVDCPEAYAIVCKLSVLPLMLMPLVRQYVVFQRWSNILLFAPENMQHCRDRVGTLFRCDLNATPCGGEVLHVCLKCLAPGSSSQRWSNNPQRFASSPSFLFGLLYIEWYLSLSLSLPLSLSIHIYIYIYLSKINEQL